MTNEQLLYWIEGYLADKHTAEAYTIKNKIAAQRTGTPVSPVSPSLIKASTSSDSTRAVGDGRGYIPPALPQPQPMPVWLNTVVGDVPF